MATTRHVHLIGELCAALVLILGGGITVALATLI